VSIHSIGKPFTDTGRLSGKPSLILIIGASPGDLTVENRKFLIFNEKPTGTAERAWMPEKLFHGG
jgi:hypothetical protein